MDLENSSSSKSFNGSLWRKAQTMRRQERKQSFKTNKHKRILMKRRSRPRRPMNGIKRRVTILKKLVPNGRSKGMDALFKETADYIVWLQMRVKVMQMMVKLLSATKE